MSLKKIHSLIGLVLSLIMLSISITGVVLVWKKEYLWLSFNDARQSVDRTLLPAAIDKIEAQYAPDQVIFIQLHSEGLALHKVFLNGKEYAWHNQHGEQMQRWSGNERWEDWFLDLHHRFFLGNTIGLNIAGFGGLILMPLMMLGFVIWWPRRRTFRLRLLPRSTARGSILRSHGNIGAVAILPVFLIALTGVILVYPVEARWLFITQPDEAGQSNPKAEFVQLNVGELDWGELIAASHKRFPGSIVRSVSPSTSMYPTRSISLQQSDALYPGGYTRLSVTDHTKLEVHDAKSRSLAQHGLNFSYQFHAAKLGLLFRVLISLVGLALALMSSFGLYSYVLSVRRE